MSVALTAAPLLVTKPAAARLLNICDRTLQTLTAPRGPIACVRIGRSVRYDPRDLIAWINASKTQWTAATA
jgi:hypothetical protein